MNKILKKQILNESTILMVIDSPKVAKRALAGQFIMLRLTQGGERIPLTIADFNRELGTVTIIFQTIGATTNKLSYLNEGDFILDFVGPLGNPTEIKGLKKVAIIGGGVGCAIALPVAKALHTQGALVHSIIGFRTHNLVILENEFKSVSDKLIVTTDDGSYGQKGLVTNSLENLINSGENYDEVIVIGPLIMMKFVCNLTKKYNIKTTVSMNPIMIDGTGMCGGCRLTVDGKIKFACVDGPDFDGHKVDFDEIIARSNMYEKHEHHSLDKTCNLFKERNELK